MKKNNRKLASYIAEVLGDEYEEAEAENIEPLSEKIFQALEVYEKIMNMNKVCIISEQFNN